VALQKNILFLVAATAAHSPALPATGHIITQPVYFPLAKHPRLTAYYRRRGTWKITSVNWRKRAFPGFYDW